MSAKKIRLGIIGCGWVARFYGIGSRALSDRCEWAWAADPHLSAAEKFCATYGGEPRADYRGAKADAIVIATPHHLHAPMYLERAPTGVPILIEKPLALSVEEADRMIAARDKAKALLMVGYVNRYRRGPRALKQAIEDGKIGEPMFWDAHQFCDVEGYVTGWLAKKATLGGGVFFSSSGHLLDLLMWYNGPVERLKLETARYRIAMEGEDTQLSVIRFQNGRLATMRESWCAQGAQPWQCLRVFGTNGSLSMSYTPRGRLIEGDKLPWDTRVTWHREGEPDQTLLEHTGEFDFTGQLEHFLDCIEHSRQPLTTAESAREVIRVTRAAEAASA
jgi:predicted dehydrogenase